HSFHTLTTPRLPRHLPSFPTRRSSDLSSGRGQQAAQGIARKQQPVVQQRNAAGELFDFRKGVRGKQKCGAALADQIVFEEPAELDRKSTRLNSSHQIISYAVFCLKKQM